MKAIRAVGALLVVLCVAGFFTVADDLRHTGELLGVGSVGVIGLALFVFAQRALRRRQRGTT